MLQGDCVQPAVAFPAFGLDLALVLSLSKGSKPSKIGSTEDQDSEVERLFDIRGAMDIIPIVDVVLRRRLRGRS